MSHLSPWSKSRLSKLKSLSEKGNDLTRGHNKKGGRVINDLIKGSLYLMIDGISINVSYV